MWGCGSYTCCVLLYVTSSNAVPHQLIGPSPSCSPPQGLGVLGAVIMPHNLYLHSGLVLVRMLLSPLLHM